MDAEHQSAKPNAGRNDKADGDGEDACERPSEHEEGKDQREREIEGGAVGRVSRRKGRLGFAHEPHHRWWTRSADDLFGDGRSCACEPERDRGRDGDDDNTTYSYTVKAIDGARNQSPASNTATATAITASSGAAPASVTSFAAWTSDALR